VRLLPGPQPVQFSLEGAPVDHLRQARRVDGIGHLSAEVSCFVVHRSLLALVGLAPPSFPFLLCFCVCRFGELFDRAEPPLPLCGVVSHGPSGLVEAGGLHLVQDFSALFAPTDQADLFEHDEVLGDRLAGKGYLPGQPAGADVTMADKKVEDLPTRGLGNSRPQHIIDLRRHPNSRAASTLARR
jgi:hypothetical protein